MPTTPVRPAAIVVGAVVGAATLLLAGCGSGSATAPSRSADTPAASSAGSSPADSSPADSSPADVSSGLSAQELTKQAFNRITTASSVRIHGDMSDSGEKISLDTTHVPGKGCQGKLGMGGKGSFQVKIIGSTIWLFPDKLFWTSQGLKDPAVLAVVSGKWIKVSPKGDFASIAEFCSLKGLLGDDLSKAESSGLEKGGTTTINGVPAIEIKNKGADENLFVSTGAKPELLEITSTKESGKIDFSDYDAKVTLTPPPAAKTLDGKKYGM